MEDVGYAAFDKNGIPGRRYFQRAVDDYLDHHLHAFESGNSEKERHRSFSDYLRAHPQFVEKYGTMRARLAEGSP